MLHSMLSRFVRLGRLRVTEPGKAPKTFGDGSGAEVAICVGKGWSSRIALNPDMALGEAYMEGGLVMEQGTLWDLCELIGRNFVDGPPPGPLKRALHPAPGAPCISGTTAASSRSATWPTTTTSAPRALPALPRWQGQCSTAAPISPGRT